jgi:GNAT superfamily N-acetyltransferase
VTAVLLRRAQPEEIDEVMRIDDEAASLYASAGLSLEYPEDHPAVQAERKRWLAAAEDGRLLLAIAEGTERAGFASTMWVDGEPYLDQLSVHPAYMRRGIGRKLLHATQAWCVDTGAEHLWLTTYAHLSWNGPFYVREGFVEIPEEACGPELRAILQNQRTWLPAPEQRVAMRWSVPDQKPPLS